MIRRLHLHYFGYWSSTWEPALPYLARLPDMDLDTWVSDPQDGHLMRMARLDCDHAGEWLRVLTALEHPDLHIAQVSILGRGGVQTWLEALQHQTPGEEHWLVLFGQTIAELSPHVGRVAAYFRSIGGRILFWSWDNLSRRMPLFPAELAPHLSILLHDEAPLSDDVQKVLPPSCLRIHTSPLANFIPFAHPFHETTDPLVVFLGSQVGVTDHRARQFQALQAHFQDRFLAIQNHTVSVADRPGLGRARVQVCPEGRHFTEPEMAATHTDRPFWAGCLGQVPVIEDARHGGRLQPLVEAGLVLRYPHGDIPELIETCERALETDMTTRCRIYDHFNRKGTMGPLIAECLAKAGRP